MFVNEEKVCKDVVMFFCLLWGIFFECSEIEFLLDVFYGDYYCKLFVFFNFFICKYRDINIIIKLMMYI